MVQKRFKKILWCRLQLAYDEVLLLVCGQNLAHVCDKTWIVYVAASMRLWEFGPTASTSAFMFLVK